MRSILQVQSKKENMVGVVELIALVRAKNLERPKFRTHTHCLNKGRCSMSSFCDRSSFRAKNSKQLGCIFIYMGCKSVSAWIYQHPSK